MKILINKYILLTLLVTISSGCSKPKFKVNSKEAGFSRLSSMARESVGSIGSSNGGATTGTIGSGGGGTDTGTIGTQPGSSPLPTATLIATATATPVPTATLIATPTATPVPTATITANPTPTPQPTATITAKPSPTPTATITPTPSKGECGSSANQASYTAPTTNLCKVGTASAIQSNGWGFYWQCSVGSTRTGTVSCSTKRIVDGVCGEANGKQFGFKPSISQNLCAQGSPSEVSESGGRFNWTCNGLEGGKTAACSATITTTKTTDIPLWQRCGAKPSEFYDPAKLTPHDPKDTIFELRKTSDLSLVCRIDKVAIGNLSEYGRPDVPSIDLTVIDSLCGEKLNRDGANNYRVFILDRAHYKDAKATFDANRGWTEEDNMLLIGSGSFSKDIGGWHEQNSLGFNLIRRNQSAPWCLAYGQKYGSGYTNVDCGDNIDTYLKTKTSKSGKPFNPIFPGGHLDATGEGIWSYAISIISWWNADANPDLQLIMDLDPLCNAMGSPLVVDFRDNNSEAIPMTSIDEGIKFDLLGENSFPYAHAKKQISWVKDAAVMFLVKPNKKGEVNGINEMFGDNTMGPDGQFAANGYLSLAKYKLSKNDTAITEKNPVFKELRLWSDKNFDGKAQPNELLTLKEMKVKEIKLGYDKNYVKRDTHGNEVRYRSEVVLNNKKTVPMYDIFFKYRTPASPTMLTAQ